MISIHKAFWVLKSPLIARAYHCFVRRGTQGLLVVVIMSKEYRAGLHLNSKPVPETCWLRGLEHLLTFPAPHP